MAFVRDNKRPESEQNVKETVSRVFIFPYKDKADLQVRCEIQHYR